MNNFFITAACLAVFATAPAIANDLSGNRGFCSVLACSQRGASDFEGEAKRLEKKHPGNAALKALVRSLDQKPPQGKRAEIVRFFQFNAGMDGTDKQRTIESRLNDGQSDKLTNVEVEGLVAILEGQSE